MTNAALRGKPDAGNPHVRFDEGEIAPAATPRRGSLLYTPEVGETDYRIGTFIIRLFCGIVGVVGLVGMVVGLVSWLEDRSAYTSLWTALVGDEPYGRVSRLGGFRLGGGKLWRLTPNGLLPACGELCLWVASLASALFHRWWLYALMVGLLFLMDI